MKYRIALSVMMRTLQYGLPLLLVVLLFFLLQLVDKKTASRPQRAYAMTYNNGENDSCNRITLQNSENPSCQRLVNPSQCTPNPQQTNPVSSYTFTVNVSSNDGQPHTVTYTTYSDFCTNGWTTMNPNTGWCECNDNPLIINKTVTTPATITVSRTPTSGSSCGSYQADFYITAVDGNTDCNYGDLNNLIAGSSGQCETGITCPASTPTPTPTPTPSTYTISGNVFNDTNKDGLLDNGEQNYPGGITITATGGTVQTNNGSFSVTGLTPGSYTLSYTTLPTGYNMVYPRNGPPPSFLVTVGPGCSVDTTSGALCTNGNVTNLNFAITNSTPWIQFLDGDMRMENGLNTPLPASANAQCGGAYASVQDTNAKTPGIPFSGDSPSDFGQGQASSTQWIVGGAIYPETVQTNYNERTEYNNLYHVATRAGLAITDLTTVPGCTDLTNCTLPANLSDGLYQAKNSLVLNGYTFPAGKNYVFLINGDLTMMGNSIVPIGSTALFSASGSIYIDKGVKAAVDTCPIPTGQIQGMFSADKNFVVQGRNDCTQGKDTMLNIEGSVVVNAARGGGSFTNQRDLCSDNTSYPAVTIRTRPDFLLNAPAFLMQTNTFSSEEAP